MTMRPLALYVDGGRSRRDEITVVLALAVPCRSSAFFTTNSPIEVARRPTLKSPFLPWMVLMASWRGW